MIQDEPSDQPSKKQFALLGFKVFLHTATSTSYHADSCCPVKNSAVSIFDIDILPKTQHAPQNAQDRIFILAWCLTPLATIKANAEFIHALKELFLVRVAG